MNKTPVYAYLDESGSFYKSHGYFIIAILLTSAPRALQKIIRKTREGMKHVTAKREHSLAELKFYNASDFTKEKVLSLLGNNQEVEIYLLSLEIEEDTADTPENYAQAVWIVLQECLKRHTCLSFVVDLHINVVEQRARFDRVISQYAGMSIQIAHKDSQRDNLLQLVDFVAGATYYRNRRHNSEFYNLFSNRIVATKCMKWPLKEKKTETPQSVLPDKSGGPR
jgi:hypothetical protein